LAIGNNKLGDQKHTQSIYMPTAIYRKLRPMPCVHSKGLPLRVILASRVSYPKPGLTVRTHEIQVF